MDRRKRIMVLTVSILAVAILASASSWEGSAMMGSYGDFPSGGFFAACNSFPRNTAVEVTNLETGKSVTVIVVRGLDNPGVFMMVSAEAAEALGLRQGRITRVRAVEPRSVSSLAPSAGTRRALDSDFNPRLLAAEELKRMGYELVETPSAPAKASEASPSPAVATVPPEAKTEESAAVTEVPEAVDEPSALVPAEPVPVFIPPLAKGPELVQDLIRPQPAVSETVPVPVPSPEVPRSRADVKPDAINGGKPKPVRTVMLPELPEPALPPATVVVPPLVAAEPKTVDLAPPVEPKPEIFALTLPVPDETPLRVSPSPVPRRFEAPAALPDVLDKPRLPELVPEALVVSLAEPGLPGPETVVALPFESPQAEGSDPSLTLLEPEAESEERAVAEERQSPAQLAEKGSFGLTEPVSGPASQVVAHELMTPVKSGSQTLAVLAWPELEADEIPDVVLARLSEPAQMIPATSLAEGEVIFPQTGAPYALSRETPSFAAAETRVALAAPEVEDPDQAEVLGPSITAQASPDMSIELAEADLRSEAPLVQERTAPAVLGEDLALAVDTPVMEAAEEAAAVDVQTPVPVRTTPEVEIATPALDQDLPGEVIVVLEPSDLRPPVADAPVVAEVPALVQDRPEVKPPEPVASPPQPVQPSVVSARPAMVLGSLEKGKHYIQVGAYRSEAAAADTVSVLRMDYVIVLETLPGSTTRIWKIFVGPLGRDESGMALLRVRSLGFKDAFLKVGS